MDVFVVVLIFILCILTAVLVYVVHTTGVFKGRLRREVHEADEVLHKTFDLLIEDIQEQIQLLENARSKRELTIEEEKVITQLKKDLFDAEKFIRKEIKDIEKEVE